MKYSLLSLFIVTAAVATYLAIIVTLPEIATWLCLILLTALIPAVVVTGIVHDRGYWRTFWIGCISPLIVPLLWRDFLPDALSFYEELAFVVIHIAIASSGLAAVATRWLIDRKNRVAASDSPT